VYLEPDRLAAVEGELGTLVIEDLIEGVGQQLRSQLQPGDTAAASRRAASRWSSNAQCARPGRVVARVLQRMSEAVFHAGEAVGADHVQCGGNAAQRTRRTAGRAAAGGDQVSRAAAAAGGNRLLRHEQPGEKPELDETDRVWARASSRR